MAPRSVLHTFSIKIFQWKGQLGVQPVLGECFYAICEAHLVKNNTKTDTFITNSCLCKVLSNYNGMPRRSIYICGTNRKQF